MATECQTVVDMLFIRLFIRAHMLTSVRDAGPVVLIPAAWIAAGAALFEHLTMDGLLIAHLVMAGFISFFAVTGWNRMAEGALRAWRTVLVAGLFVTLAGIGGFLIPAYETPLLTTSLVGWMLLPAAGLLYTSLQIPEAKVVYIGGGMLSIAGAGLYLLSLLVTSDLLVVLALGAVCLGQTAGIVDAARRDR